MNKLCQECEFYQEMAEDTLMTDKLVIDTKAKRVYQKGYPVTVNPKEYALLEYMYKNKGRVLSRDQILEEIWPDIAVRPDLNRHNIINVYICKLRSKFGNPVIKSVRNIGYSVPDTTRNSFLRALSKRRVNK